MSRRRVLSRTDARKPTERQRERQTGVRNVSGLKAKPIEELPDGRFQQRMRRLRTSLARCFFVIGQTRGKSWGTFFLNVAAHLAECILACNLVVAT